MVCNSSFFKLSSRAYLSWWKPLRNTDSLLGELNLVIIIKDFYGFLCCGSLEESVKQHFGSTCLILMRFNRPRGFLLVCFNAALLPPWIPLRNKERQPCSAVKGLMISGVPQQQMLEAWRWIEMRIFIYRASAYTTDPSHAPPCVGTFLVPLQWGMGLSLY